MVVFCLCLLFSVGFTTEPLQKTAQYTTPTGSGPLRLSEVSSSAPIAPGHG